MRCLIRGNGDHAITGITSRRRATSSKSVQPPYSGNFIINGICFTGVSPACFGWTAGDRITLVAGDWHGHCLTAVFYNFRRHSTCEHCAARPSNP